MPTVRVTQGNPQVSRVSSPSTQQIDTKTVSIGPVSDASATAAFEAANNATITAGAAFDVANAASGITIGVAFDKANAANILACTAYSAANTASIEAAGAHTTANAAATTASAAWDRSVVANTTAAAAFSQANSLNYTAQSAYSQANTASLEAGGAHSTANDALGTAQAAYGQANGLNFTAQSAYSQANTATTDAATASGEAAGAHTKANSVLVTAIAGYAQANSLNFTAQSAYDKANTATTYAGAAYDTANSGTSEATAANTTAQAAFDEANSLNFTAQSAYSQANTATTDAATASAEAGGAHGTANNALGTAQASYAQANSLNFTAQSAYIQANTASLEAGGAHAQANTATTDAATASGEAAGAHSTANDALGTAQAAYGQANGLNFTAQSAYSQANTASLEAGGAHSTANDASTTAGSAYDHANTKYASAGGTISGDVEITGNLVVSGDQTFANTQHLLIGDAVLTLNSDLPQATSPSEDAGIEINRGSSSNVSVLWDEVDNIWTFSNDGTTWQAIASNVDIQNVGTGANAYAALAAGGAHAAANTGVSDAATAQGTADVAAAQAVIARGDANTNAGDITASAAEIVIARDQANTGVTDAATASAEAGGAHATANSATTTAGAAYDAANAFSELSEDLSPQLGANLDAQGYTIKNTQSIHITGGGSAGNWTPFAGRETLIVENDGDVGITFAMPDTATAAFVFATASDDHAGSFRFDYPNELYQIQTSVTNGAIEFRPGNQALAQKLYANLTSVFSNNVILKTDTSYIGWSDARLYHDAANAVAVINGVHGQTFKIYNTHDGAANTESGLLGWSGNQFIIGATRSGTGSFRNMVFQTSNTTRWKVTASGNFIAGADNSYDVGEVADNRPQNIHAANGVFTPSLFVNGANHDVTAQSAYDQANTAYIHANNAYAAANAGGGGASVTIANTPPGGASAGDMWWSSNVASGQLYVYYDDSANSQWVLASPPWSITANIVSDLTPQLGADLDLNGFNIDFPSTSNIDDVLDEDDLTSNSATGLATQQSIKAYVDQYRRSFTAGEVCNVGDVCYFKSDGKMWQTDADAEASSGGLLSICTEDIAADASGDFLLRGYYVTSGLTTASTYFLSTTKGAWTTTQPSGNTDIVRVIGYALSTTELYFDPDKSYVQVLV